MIVPPDFLLAHPDLLSSLPDRPACLLLRPEACCADAAVVLRRTMPMSTDALSEVLSAVHLTGSVFFDVTAKSPWVAEAPPAAQIAHQVTPGAVSWSIMSSPAVRAGYRWWEMPNSSQSGSRKGILQSFRTATRTWFPARRACAPNRILISTAGPRMTTHCPSRCDLAATVRPTRI